MSDAKAIADHWDQGDIYGRIVSVLQQMSKPLDRLTIEALPRCVRKTEPHQVE